MIVGPGSSAPAWWGPDSHARSLGGPYSEPWLEWLLEEPVMSGVVGSASSPTSSGAGHARRPVAAQRSLRRRLCHRRLPTAVLGLDHRAFRRANIHRRCTRWNLLLLHLRERAPHCVEASFPSIHLHCQNAPAEKWAGVKPEVSDVMMALQRQIKGRCETAYGLCDDFDIERGVMQGCVASPARSLGCGASATGGTSRRLQGAH